MDLALELGWPAEALARVMPEREFRRWIGYSRRRLLPSARVEFYLAQIARLIAVTMGGMKNAKISDFMIQEPDVDIENIDPEKLVEVAREAFQFNPRKRKPRVKDGK